MKTNSRPVLVPILLKLYRNYSLFVYSPPFVTIQVSSASSRSKSSTASAHDSPLPSDDEYLSVASDNNLSPTYSSSEQLYSTVDEMLDGSDSDKENAYNMLAALQQKVSFHCVPYLVGPHICHNP